MQPVFLEGSQKEGTPHIAGRHARVVGGKGSRAREHCRGRVGIVPGRYGGTVQGTWTRAAPLSPRPSLLLYLTGVAHPFTAPGSASWGQNGKIPNLCHCEFPWGCSLGRKQWVFFFFFLFPRSKRQSPIGKMEFPTNALASQRPVKAKLRTMGSLYGVLRTLVPAGHLSLVCSTSIPAQCYPCPVCLHLRSSSVNRM